MPSTLRFGVDGTRAVKVSWSDYGIYAVSRTITCRHSAAVQQPPLPPPAKPRPSRATSFDPLAAKAFGQAVRALRERLGVAQDQFALSANIDRSYYGKLERGERQPSLGLLLRAAKALGISAAVLVQETENIMRVTGDAKQRRQRSHRPKAR